MKLKRLKVITKTILLSYKATKKLFVLDVFLSMIAGCLGAIILFATTNLFNVVEAAGRDSAYQTDKIVRALGLYIGVLLIKVIIDWTSDSLSFVISEKSIITLSEILHTKANRINSVSYEDPKLLDYIQNAGRGIYFIDYCSKNIINLLIRDIPYLIFVGFYLYTLTPILFWIPILIFIPVVVSQISRTKMYIDLRDEKTPLERKMSNYGSYIIEPEYFGETRTLGCYLYLRKLYTDTIKILNSKTWKMERNSQIIEVLSKLITLIGYYGVLFLLFISLMNHSISVGEFAAVFASLQMFYDTVDHIIVQRIGSIIMNEYTEIDSMINFLAIPEREYGTEDAQWDKIKLKKVSFSYPGREEKALKDIDLEIERGECVAIVGRNGSGKTTLAKLILGLYLPTNGEIFTGDKKYHELSRDALFENKSAVFQNYYKYLFDLRDNISISDMNTNVQEERLNSASDKAGLNYTNTNIFPKGYNTLLSKRFGGVELSGGEWQRVAIARGIYRKSKVIILDEPTASIDPVEEGNVFRRFIDASQDKTTIIITHRLGSTKIADRILVMENGQIIQSGTHETLMQEKGLYYTMYESQAQWYK